MPKTVKQRPAARRFHPEPIIQTRRSFAEPQGMWSWLTTVSSVLRGVQQETVLKATTGFVVEHSYKFQPGEVSIQGYMKPTLKSRLLTIQRTGVQNLVVRAYRPSCWRSTDI